MFRATTVDELAKELTKYRHDFAMPIDLHEPHLKRILCGLKSHADSGGLSAIVLLDSIFAMLAKIDRQNEELERTAAGLATVLEFADHARHCAEFIKHSGTLGNAMQHAQDIIDSFYGRYES